MKKYIGLENQQNERIYGTSINDLSETFELNKGNLSQFFNDKRNSIGGYTTKREVELLNVNYDTIILKRSNCKIDPHLLRFLITQKEILAFEDTITVDYRNVTVDVQSTTFNRYEVVCKYLKYFQIGVGTDKAEIRILAKAFYRMSPSEIFDNLKNISYNFFDTMLEDWKVSNLDLAIDCRFDFDFMDYLLKNFTDKVKPYMFDKASLSTHGTAKGRSVRCAIGGVQFTFYDKIMELYQLKDDEKKAIFSKVFNIDLTNSFEIQDYLDSDYQIVRFEYRLKNKSRFIESFDIDVATALDVYYVKGVISYLLKKHSTMKIPEMRIYEDVLSSDVDIRRVDVSTHNAIAVQIENTLKMLTGALSGIHSKLEYLANVDYSQGEEIPLKEVFEFIELKYKEPEYNYNNKLNDKRAKLRKEYD